MHPRGAHLPAAVRCGLGDGSHPTDPPTPEAGGLWPTWPAASGGGTALLLTTSPLLPSFPLLSLPFPLCADPAFVLSGVVDLLAQVVVLPPGTDHGFLASALSIMAFTMATHEK